MAFDYTFDNVASVIDAFTVAKGLDRYAIYVFDYGAPVGWRLAVANPQKITAIVSQNGKLGETRQSVIAQTGNCSKVKRIVSVNRYGIATTRIAACASASSSIAATITTTATARYEP